jgi:hypothetical protein
MKTCGGVEVQFHAVLTSALDENEFCLLGYTCRGVTRSKQYSWLIHSLEGVLIHSLEGVLIHSLEGVLIHNLEGVLMKDLIS